MCEETFLKVWFCNIDGIDMSHRKKLIDVFGSISDIYQASSKLLSKYLNEKQLINLVMSREEDKVNSYIHRLKENNIQVIYPSHPDYPQKLKNIYNPPDILYVKGRLKETIGQYNRNIAIVGSRLPDTYGREIAGYFARELGKRSINIISGLAKGIDSVAHKGSLEGNGYTVGVLGCGINLVYPRENMELYINMEEKGAIISEYGLDAEPMPYHFPNRNRIISGLSDGVLIVEAKEKSGSLITADFALEQGKQVYAVPGRIFDKNSAGTNKLIKMGAMCVTSYEDIIRDLNIEIENDVKNDVNKNSLAPIEKIVYSCLSLEPMYIDDIIQKADIGITKAISVLYIMEEKGIIKQPVKGYYIVAI